MVFCSKCGKPIGEEDTFCRHCGAQVLESGMSGVVETTQKPAKRKLGKKAKIGIGIGITAVVVAIGACLTIFRHKIISFFKKNKEQGKKEIHFVDEESEDNK